MAENLLGVLNPEVKVITIGKDEYPVPEFCLAKSLDMLARLTDLAERADLASTLADLADGGWSVALVRGLPRLIKTSKDEVYQVMALTLINNKRYYEIIENDGDLNAEVKAVAKMLKTNDGMSFDKMFEIVQVGYERMGLDALKRNFTTLLGKVGLTVAPQAAEPTDEQTPENVTPISS